MNNINKTNLTINNANKKSLTINGTNTDSLTIDRANKDSLTMNNANREFTNTLWDGRPYYSLNSWLKQKFGTKVYKLSLDGGMTCPNRDGKLGTRGCIFCSEGGSGDFSAGNTTSNFTADIRTSDILAAHTFISGSPDNPSANILTAHALISGNPLKNTLKNNLITGNPTEEISIPGNTFDSAGNGYSWHPRYTQVPNSPHTINISAQIETAKSLVSKKIPSSGPYIAYFQSFTNTYAPVSYLEPLFTEAIAKPEIAALSVATRPDCLEPEKIRLLHRLNAVKPVWTELGLQTIHPWTAAFIRRGYPLSCFEETVKRLKDAGLTVIVHLILGLPGESREEMLESVDYLAHFSPAIDGIKLQLLHVLKGTDLAKLYADNPFPLFSLEEYVDFVITCLEHLPPSMVIHRLTGDGPKKLLIAPDWSGDKKRVLNTFTRRFRQRDTWQGRCF